MSALHCLQAYTLRCKYLLLKHVQKEKLERIQRMQGKQGLTPVAIPSRSARTWNGELKVRFCSRPPLYGSTRHTSREAPLDSERVRNWPDRWQSYA